jgi:hypothetical protein
MSCSSPCSIINFFQMSNPRVDISKYLSNKVEGKNAHGLCRVCMAKVYWTTQKLLSHKRGGNCTGQCEPSRS